MRMLATAVGAAALICGAAALAEPETGSRLDRRPMAVTDSANDPVVPKVVNQFARCVASNRPAWSDQVLAMQFLSSEQLKAVGKEAGGMHICFSTGQYDLQLHSLSVLGGMAEQRIEAKFASQDVSGLSALTDDQLFASAAAPKTTTEDFALCIVRKDPAAVRRLIKSEPTSAAEAQQVKALVPHLGGCLPKGLNIKLNKQTVRAYSAVGLHHLLANQAVLASAKSGQK